jgi:predicted nucleic acid-binding protein
LLEELEDVSSREKFARKLAAANVTVQDLVLGYSALATVIEAKPIEPVILVDPDDDAVLNRAGTHRRAKYFICAFRPDNDSARS